MPKLIWDFNEFMKGDFKTLSMGFTPSGHLHVGFLSTLACALMYLKEHPGTMLVITNIENSLSSKLEKYNNTPLRFQYLIDGSLAIPADQRQLRKRDTVAKKVHAELCDLIWKLAQIFDVKTKAEQRQTIASPIPNSHKQWLGAKENKIFRLFNNPIQVLSFSEILKKDTGFRRSLLGYISDFGFSQITVPLFLGAISQVREFEGTIVWKGKRYTPKKFIVPIRLYCPNCFQIATSWADIVLGHPEFKTPTLATLCKTKGCPRENKHILQNLKDPWEFAEFHFLLDPMRDFFPPFQADLHLFGGDYFQLEYELSGKRAIDKVQEMFSFLEEKTGQEKFLFGGPLITINGKKMSKSEEAFNLKDIKNISKAFLSIVSYLEESRSQSFPYGMMVEYRTILKKAA